MNGHSEVVRVLADKGADLQMKTKDGNTPAHIAADVWCKFDKDGIRRTDLYTEKKIKMSKVMKILVSYGADLHAMNDIGETPAYIAATDDNFEIVEVMAEKTDFNTKCRLTGRTPTHAAASHGSLNVLQILLENEANPNVCDN